ncbi:zinc finger protein basonuclin-2 [Chanos chanos]|uniref:Zinc finger protein basonuclin-2 n=1 Tax=Chanos chanos TaxID=29144 RepID=A0A6J2VF68_CHACN|nr:zinc finger protein basonuclin-2-like [Chanos chanos]
MGTWRHTLHRVNQQDIVSRSSLKCNVPSMTRDLEEVISCTQVNCSCECFQPGKVNLRSCQQCKHGWVAHAVGKLSGQESLCSGQVEIVQANVVFDISSLMLYGTQALPIRMKILLDRLFSVLKQEEVLTILHTLGWTLRDYVRGYILQDSMGKVLDRWVIMSQEEELATLHQFLRFGETKSIVELMTVQEQEGLLASSIRETKSDSDIQSFIRSTKLCPSPRLQFHTENGRVRSQASPSLHHFENLPGGNLSFLLPFQYLSLSTAPQQGSETTPSHVLESATLAPSLQQPGQVKHNNNTDSSQSEMASPYFSPVRASNSPKTITANGRGDPKRIPKCISSVKSESALLSPASSSCWGSRERKLGAAMRKGRVCCNACGKTFYDKGTLKIHYNAVHLKIKHRCTVEGCNMVFSSLRSRNRHSANPNPRLHAPALRNTRSPKPPQHSVTVSPSEGKPQMGLSPLSFPTPPVLEPQQSSLIFPLVKTVQPLLPFYQTLLSSGNTVNPSISTSSSPVISKTSNDKIEINLQLHTQQFQRSFFGDSPLQGGPVSRPQTTDCVSNVGSEPMPKKKPRKSSMPVKIKREAPPEQERCDYENDRNDDDEIKLQFSNAQSHINGREINGKCYQSHSNNSTCFKDDNHAATIHKPHEYNHTGYMYDQDNGIQCDHNDGDKNPGNAEENRGEEPGQATEGCSQNTTEQLSSLQERLAATVRYQDNDEREKEDRDH